MVDLKMVLIQVDLVLTKVAEMLDSIPDWVNDIPKQVIRQQEASRHFKNKKNKHT
jgi:hypothetical protein